MFEFHGWASLRYHAHDTDTSRQTACWSLVDQHVREMQAPIQIWMARGNCLDSLTVSGQHNHRNEYVLDLFRWIAHHAPGSYGLLYIRDDEDDAGDNGFRVWRLCRGTLEIREDPFLSPFVPVVEDPYDPTRND